MRCPNCLGSDDVIAGCLGDIIAGRRSHITESPATHNSKCEKRQELSLTNNKHHGREIDRGGLRNWNYIHTCM